MEHQIASFHLFPLLAPELRNRIWELSLERRVVVIDGEIRMVNVLEPDGMWIETWSSGRQWMSFYKETKQSRMHVHHNFTPAVLHACRESRSLLTMGEPFYTKAFQEFYTKICQGRAVKLPDYVWVNFAIDTISMSTWHYETMNNVAVEKPLTRRLMIQEESDTEYFYRHRINEIKTELGHYLQNLVIRVKASRMHEHLLWDWIDVMEEFVEPKDSTPATFDVRIVFFPDDGIEINSMNYPTHKQEMRRAVLKRQGYTDFEIENDSGLEV